MQLKKEVGEQMLGLNFWCKTARKKKSGQE